jgi:hypothetical protein
VGKSGLALLSSRGLASEPGIEPTAAEPQEDELGGSRLACLSGALAMCSLLLVSVSSSLLLASASSSFLLASMSSSLLLVSASSLLAGTSGLLIEELLAVGSLLLASVSSLLAGTSGLLIEELLVAGSLLLASASGLFLDETEAMVLVRPQFVNGPLPIPVRAVRARKLHEEWAPQVALAAAIRQPVGLHGWLVEANLHCESVDQRCPGGGGL